MVAANSDEQQDMPWHLPPAPADEETLSLGNL